MKSGKKEKKLGERNERDIIVRGKNVEKFF